MKLTSLDAKEIASRGGGLIINATDYTTLDLKEMASRISGSGGTLIIRNATKLTSQDAKEIASRGAKHVILDYTA